MTEIDGSADWSVVRVFVFTGPPAELDERLDRAASSDDDSDDDDFDFVEVTVRAHGRDGGDFLRLLCLEAAASIEPGVIAPASDRTSTGAVRRAVTEAFTRGRAHGRAATRPTAGDAASRPATRRSGSGAARPARPDGWLRDAATAVGVVVLASTSAGALAAVLIKQSIVEKAIEGAVAGLITTTASEAWNATRGTRADARPDVPGPAANPPDAPIPAGSPELGVPVNELSEAAAPEPERGTVLHPTRTITEADKVEEAEGCRGATPAVRDIDAPASPTDRTGGVAVSRSTEPGLPPQAHRPRV